MDGGSRTKKLWLVVSQCATISNEMSTSGAQFKRLSSTPTRIPLTEFDRLALTRSSPEDIAASLNAMELSASSGQRTLHGNARRVYPFWKVCRICSAIFPCLTKEAAVRNVTCDRKCAGRATAEKTTGVHRKPSPTCGMCGAEFRPKGNLALSKAKFCTTKCAAANRMSKPGAVARLRAIAPLGYAGWTDASRASYTPKMSGANNPAWKGGVTYHNRHGNYGATKYVRCPPEFLSMARKDGYVMEHRLVVARAIGRTLTRAETVHHVDHNPTNNALANLLLFATNRDHKLFEARGTPAPIWRP